MSNGTRQRTSAIYGGVCQTLIMERKYFEAAKMLDIELAKKEDAHLYYLRAMVSYKLKNYEYAREMLEHALFLKKEPDYLKLKAIICMEILEFSDALEILEKLLEEKKDAESYFLSSVCYMFLDSPKSREYLQLAYLADKPKTKFLVKEFYNQFFKDNRFLSEKERNSLAEKIAAIK